MTILDFEQVTIQTIPIDGMSIGSSSLSIDSKVAILDTGTSLLAAPFQEGLDLMEELQDYSECIINQGTFTCKCNNLNIFPNITFFIQGHQFPIQPKDYFLPNGKGECILLISLMQGFKGYQPFWILGDVFLRRYYVVFDMGKRRVGLTPSINPSISQQIVEIPWIEWFITSLIAVLLMTTVVCLMILVCRTYKKRRGEADGFGSDEENESRYMKLTDKE